MSKRETENGIVAGNGKNQISRRDFLRVSTLLGLSAALAACAPKIIGNENEGEELPDPDVRITKRPPDNENAKAATETAQPIATPTRPELSEGGEGGPYTGEQINLIYEQEKYKDQEELLDRWVRNYWGKARNRPFHPESTELHYKYLFDRNNPENAIVLLEAGGEEYQGATFTQPFNMGKGELMQNPPPAPEGEFDIPEGLGPLRVSGGDYILANVDGKLVRVDDSGNVVQFINNTGQWEEVQSAETQVAPEAEERTGPKEVVLKEGVKVTLERSPRDFLFFNEEDPDMTRLRILTYIILTGEDPGTTEEEAQKFVRSVIKEDKLAKFLGGLDKVNGHPVIPKMKVMQRRTEEVKNDSPYPIKRAHAVTLENVRADELVVRFFTPSERGAQLDKIVGAGTETNNGGQYVLERENSDDTITLVLHHVLPAKDEYHDYFNENGVCDDVTLPLRLKSENKLYITALNQVIVTNLADDDGVVRGYISKIRERVVVVRNAIWDNTSRVFDQKNCLPSED